jgi:hypothetical protein
MPASVYDFDAIRGRLRKMPFCGDRRLGWPLLDGHEFPAGPTVQLIFGGEGSVACRCGGQELSRAAAGWVLRAPPAPILGPFDTIGELFTALSQCLPLA